MNSKRFMIYTGAGMTRNQICDPPTLLIYCTLTLPNKPIQGPTANCSLLFISPHLKVTQTFGPLDLEKHRRVWVTSRELNSHRLTHHLHVWQCLLTWCQKMSHKEFMLLFDVTGHLPGVIFNNVSKTTKGHEESRIFSHQQVLKHS